MVKRYLFSGFLMSTLFFSPLMVSNSNAMGRSCQRDENKDFISTMKENFKNMNWNAKITGVVTSTSGTNVVGNWANDGQTAIKAVYIRDITMEKRWHRTVN